MLWNVMNLLSIGSTVNEHGVMRKETESGPRCRDDTSKQGQTYRDRGIRTQCLNNSFWR
jgi:hypothetical protein